MMPILEIERTNLLFDRLNTFQDQPGCFFSLTSPRGPQIQIQSVDYHTVYGVAMFLGVLLHPLGKQTRNVYGDRLSVVRADDGIGMLFHGGPLKLTHRSCWGLFPQIISIRHNASETVLCQRNRRAQTSLKRIYT